MAMPRLEGKVAIITGAAGGIGAAAARAFAAEGALLLVTDADAESVGQLAAELGDSAGARAHDVISEDDWATVAHQARQTHGRIDILVNNAGAFLAAPLTQTSLEDFRRVLHINTVAA